MRMSDWSSDVCSSDLSSVTAGDVLGVTAANGASAGTYDIIVDQIALAHKLSGGPVQIGGATATSSSDALGLTDTDRKSGGLGKRVSVRVDLGRRRLIKKKNTYHTLNPISN